MFEILLVIFVLFIIIYTLMYFFYFNSLCNSYSWVNEKNYVTAINKLATCKDSLICYPSDIKNDSRNKITSWKCNKMDNTLLGLDLYLSIFNNLKNSIIK